MSEGNRRAVLTWPGAIHLADGRRLAFTSMGRPSGSPVLYFHGALGTSPLAAEEFRISLSRADFRVVMVHRPGFGGSTASPGRTVSGFAADVDELSRRLGLERFAIVGVSAGGPYALACAARLGPRLSAVAVASCVPPPGRYWSRRSTALVALRMAARATGRQEGGAIAEDLAAYAGSWDFDPGSIVKPVWVWHGSGDLIAPVRFAEAIATSIPRSELKRLVGEGHFFFRRRVEEILDPLMPVTRPMRLAPALPA